MLTYLPSIIGALVAVLSVFATPIQTLVAAHPAVAGVLAGLYAILAHFLPSPTSKP